MDKTILYHLCDKNGVTIAELERDLDMSNGSLRKAGDIKSERLLAIAKYFNVSMELLMGTNEIENAPVPEFEPEHIQLISLFSQLNEAEKNIILGTMKAFISGHTQSQT